MRFLAHCVSDLEVRTRSCASLETAMQQTSGNIQAMDDKETADLLRSNLEQIQVKFLENCVSDIGH